MYRFFSFYRPFTSLTLLALLFCIEEGRAQSIRGNGGGAFSGGSLSGMNDFTDTIERPPLLYQNISLEDLTPLPSNIDTSINSVHIVEPYYRDHFLNPNLGSENSARLADYFLISKETVRLDLPAYQRMFSQSLHSSLVNVNRSFIQFHYGQGSLINTSNLSVRFYRPFARKINFNFAYSLISDNGRPTSPQNNSFSNLDLKLSQESKSGKRFTYIHFYQPKMEESVALSATSSNVPTPTSITSSKQSFVIGNRIIYRDSLSAPIKRIWNSKLIVRSTSFASNTLQIDDSNSSLILIDDVDIKSIKNQHDLGSIIFKNDLAFQNIGGGALSFGIDIGSYNHKLGADFSNSFKEGVVRVGYEKNLHEQVSFDMLAEFANFSIADQQLGGSMNKSRNLLESNIDVDLSKGFRISVLASIGQNIQSLEKSSLLINDSLWLQRDNWENLKHRKIELSLESQQTNSKIKFGATSLSNMLIVNKIGQYDQIVDPVSHVWTEIQQDVQLGPFYTQHFLKVQSVSNQRVSLPKLSYTGKIYFNLWLFKKRMFTQFGTDLYYIGPYDASEFYPVTGDFYNNNFASNSYHNFIVNPYFNAKVGPFLFFVKGINVALQAFPTSTITTDNGLLQRLYEQNLVDGFSVYPNRFKFGFKWTLLD